MPAGWLTVKVVRRMGRRAGGQLLAAKRCHTEQALAHCTVAYTPRQQVVVICFPRREVPLKSGVQTPDTLQNDEVEKWVSYVCVCVQEGRLEKV